MPLLAGQQPQPEESGGDVGLLSVFGQVLRTLDRPGAAVRAALAGEFKNAGAQLAELLNVPFGGAIDEGWNPVTDLFGLPDDPKSIEGSDLVKQWTGYDPADYYLEFGTDVAAGILLDPLTYLSGGLAGVAKGAGRAGLAAALRGGSRAAAGRALLRGLRTTDAGSAEVLRRIGANRFTDVQDLQLDQLLGGASARSLGLSDAVATQATREIDAAFDIFAEGAKRKGARFDGFGALQDASGPIDVTQFIDDAVEHLDANRLLAQPELYFGPIRIAGRTGAERYDDLLRNTLRLGVIPSLAVGALGLPPIYGAGAVAGRIALNYTGGSIDDLIRGIERGAVKKAQAAYQQVVDKFGGVVPEALQTQMRQLSSETARRRAVVESEAARIVKPLGDRVLPNMRDALDGVVKIESEMSDELNEALGEVTKLRTLNLAGVRETARLRRAVASRVSPTHAALESVADEIPVIQQATQTIDYRIAQLAQSGVDTAPFRAVRDELRDALDEINQIKQQAPTLQIKPLPSGMPQELQQIAQTPGGAVAVRAAARKKLTSLGRGKKSAEQVYGKQGADWLRNTARPALDQNLVAELSGVADRVHDKVEQLEQLLGGLPSEGVRQLGQAERRELRRLGRTMRRASRLAATRATGSKKLEEAADMLHAADSQLRQSTRDYHLAKNKYGRKAAEARLRLTRMFRQYKLREFGDLYLATMDDQVEFLKKNGVLDPDFRPAVYLPYVPSVVAEDLLLDRGAEGVALANRLWREGYSNFEKARKSKNLAEYEDNVRRILEQAGVKIPPQARLVADNLLDVMLLRNASHQRSRYVRGIRELGQQYGAEGNQAMASLTRKLVDERLPHLITKHADILRQFNRLFRPMTTIVYPGHHIMNMVGLLAQPMLEETLGVKGSVRQLNRLAVALPFAGQALRRFGNTTVEDMLLHLNGDAQALQRLQGAKIGQYSWEEVLSFAQGTVLGQDAFSKEQLVRAGFRRARDEVIPEVITRAAGKVPVAGKVFNGWLEGMSRLASGMEDRARLGTFIDLLGQGWDVEQAIKRTGDLYVNYNVQSDVDAMLRQIFPLMRFQTAMAPVVARALLEQPGNPLISLHKRAAASQRDEPGATEDSAIGMAVPGLTFRGSPIDALADSLDAIPRYSQGGVLNPAGLRQQTLARLNPLIQAPAELLTGTDFFTGREAGLEGLPNTLFSASPLARGARDVRSLPKDPGDVILRALTSLGQIDGTDLRTMKRVYEMELERAQRDGTIGEYRGYYARGELPPSTQRALEEYNEIRKELRRRYRESNR